MADECATPDVQISVTQAVPVPPRYWWLKRIAIGVAVLAIVLGVVRWWWGEYARKALQAEIDAYVAAGQPVYESDFILPPVPDDQNAAILLRQVDAKINALSPTVPDLNQTAKLRSNLRDSTLVSEQVLSLLSATSELRALARQAARMPAVQWRPDERTSNLYNHSHAIDLLVINGFVEARRNAPSEALAILQDVLRYGRHVSKHGTQISAILYGNAVRGAADVVEELLAGNAGVDARLATGLIRELADDSLHEAYYIGLYRERAWCLATLNSMVETPSNWFGRNHLDALWGRLVIPMVLLDGVRGLRRDTAWAQAMDAPDLPTCLRQEPGPPDWPSGGLKAETRSFSRYAAPNWSGRSLVHWGNIARQRMLAIALAIRLYEQAHGRLPVDLNEVVPEYLPSLPANPYVSDGRTFELDGAGTHPCLRARDADHHERAVFYLRGRPAVASATSRAS